MVTLFYYIGGLKRLFACLFWPPKTLFLLPKNLISMLNILEYTCISFARRCYAHARMTKN